MVWPEVRGIRIMNSDDTTSLQEGRQTVICRSGTSPRLIAVEKQQVYRCVPGRGNLLSTPLVHLNPLTEARLQYVLVKMVAQGSSACVCQYVSIYRDGIGIAGTIERVD